MGIFKEDLLNLGKLIDTEIEVRLSPEDFRKVYQELDFSFEEGLLRIRGKRKFLLFKRSFEFRGREDPTAVQTVKNGETKDLKVEVQIVSGDGVNVLKEKEGFEVKDERLSISLFPVLKLTELYSKIPDTFRERLRITRYKIGNGYMSVFIKVTK